MKIKYCLAKFLHFNYQSSWGLLVKAHIFCRLNMDMDAEEDGLGILVDVGNNNNAQLPKKVSRYLLTILHKESTKMGPRHFRPF